MAGVKPDVRIFEDLEVLSRAAAELFADSSTEASTQRGRFLVALSGGSTPLKLYQLLSESPFREQVDWGRAHVFWGDERCVPPEDLESSYRQVHDILLVHVPIPPGNVHRVPTELAPEAAADAYELVLREHATPPLQWPRFDLVLLGLGSDGHTASLFPGSAVSSHPTLAVKSQYEGRPAQRVTLTEAVFNSARRIIYLVSGASKARILADVLYGKSRPESLPAQRIQPPEGGLVWLVDRSAASQL